MKYSKKWLILGIIAAIACIILVATYIIKNRGEASDPPGYANEIPATQVTIHNSPSNCWIIAGTKVYDVTPNIATKPDGNKFIAYCGEQFPLASNEPSKELKDLQDQLNNYYIGLLAP